MNNMAQTSPKAFDPKLGMIARVGQTLLTMWVIGLVVLGVLVKDPYANVWQLILGQAAGGRALSISTGMSMGFPRWFLFLQCSFQDILLLLLIYPLIVAGYRRAVEMSFIGHTIVNIRATAERHKDRMRPWGPIGLVAFVVFPFWSTGALAGGVLGYLIGLRTWVTFVSVIVGNCIAVALWILLFQQMRVLSEDLVNYAPILIVIGIVVVTLFFLVRTRLKKRRQRAPQTETSVTAASAPNVPETSTPDADSETPPAV